MASGVVSMTAFVVNLPLLARGVSLYDALVADMDTETRSLGMDTFLVAVRQAQLRDLPEYVPTISAATDSLTEATKMRLTNRVYIINVTMLSDFVVPFIAHWNFFRWRAVARAGRDQ